MNESLRFILVDKDEERLEGLQGGLKEFFAEAEIQGVTGLEGWVKVAETTGVRAVVAHPEVDWIQIPRLVQESKTRWPTAAVVLWGGEGQSLMVSVNTSAMPETLAEEQDGSEEGGPVGTEVGGLDELHALLKRVLERSGVHRALDRAQRRYESLFRNLPLGLYLTNSDGDILDANAALAEILGYDDPEDLKKLKAKDLFVDPSFREAQIQQLESQGESRGKEMRLKRGDGRIIWARDHARALDDGSGTLLFQGAMEDVTSKKEAESRLRRLNEEREQERMRLNGVVSSFPEGVLVLDRERRIVMANPLAKSYLMLLRRKSSLGKLVGLGDKSLDEILDKEGKGRGHEVSLTHPRRRIFEVTASEVDGTLHGGGWVVVIREVTREREESQQAREQERLAAVGQMAAGIAHDFGNIITVMSTYSSALLEDPEIPEAMGKKLELIVEEGRKAVELVGQIQDFTRRTGGDKEITDLTLFVGQSKTFLRRTIPEDIKIEMEVDTDDCHVMGDLGALQQLLTTVALNARDSMPDGGVFRLRLRELKLKARDAAPVSGMTEGKWAVLEFTDTGSSAPEQFLPRIFDSFFGEKDSGRGSGLALAQVYGIVRQHDGFMDVGKEDALGTVLRVYLPMMKIDKKQIQPKSSGNTLPRGDGELILVVDDEESVVKSTVTALDLLGYRTLSAADGKEALEVFLERRAEIALVMSDVVMPEMGGVELLEKIRKEDPSARVVLVTGYGARVDREFIDEEIRGWLDKPWTLPELAETVKDSLH